MHVVRPVVIGKVMITDCDMIAVFCRAGGDAAGKKKRKRKKKNKGGPVKQQTDPPSIPIVEMFPKSKADALLGEIMLCYFHVLFSTVICCFSMLISQHCICNCSF